MSAGTSALHRPGGVVAGLGGQPHLAHVRDVEQAGRRPGLGMLGQDAGRVLHRHLVAGEGHEARAELAMQVVERCAFEGGSRSKRSPESRGPDAKTAPLRPPLSGDLKEFAVAGLLRRWATLVEARHFPETHPPAVRLPESFRGRLLLRRRCQKSGLSHRARLGERDLRRPPRAVHDEKHRKQALAEST